MASTTSANPAKNRDRNSSNNPGSVHQPFRRERSFVHPPPRPQVMGNFGQQRERSFVRDNSKHTYQNYVPAPVRPRGQQGSTGRGKPSMEIYRPPSVRTGDVVPVNNISRVQFQNAEEHVAPRLVKSKTSLELSFQNSSARTVKPLPVSSAGKSIQGQEATTSFALQRSKSTGSHLEFSSKSMVTAACASELPDLSQFSEEAQAILRKVAEDPNKVSARSVIEAVRHVFSRLVESSRFASTAARYCIYVVEKETNETFLESVLNTCQEWYQERDRLLRASANSPQRWVAFINFLNEMYLQLKRRTTKLNTISPGLGLSRDLILLSLLADCCCVTLKPPANHSLQELECLFFVLTGIGRDVEQELPAKMAAIMAAVRDAFLDVASLPPAAQRTLLQLVELRAAKWQLPATAVTYYYPSVSGTVY